MPEFIEELKKEHSLILDVFEKTKELGVGSEEGKRKLLSVEKDLLTHLKKEERLYHFLRKVSETDENLRRILEMFPEGIEDFSKETFNFFEKYSESKPNIGFAEDLGRLFGVLQRRIRTEENILFPEYKKLKNIPKVTSL